MYHLKHHDLHGNFPSEKYPQMRPFQKDAFVAIALRDGNLVLEAPTGTGKTAVNITFLRTLLKAGLVPLFYITPTKAEVDHVKNLHPEVRVAYGRSEYDCLYYEPEQKFKASEIPCLLLQDCPHRVDQETGETEVLGERKCPYYQAKYEAKQGGIVVCTTAFYLFTQLFSKEFDAPEGLVIDEAHRIASIVRNCLSYEITDYHLRQIIKILANPDISEIGLKKEAKLFKAFLKKMIRFAKRRPADTFGLLEDEEVVELLEVLKKIDEKEFQSKIRTAVRSGKIDTKTNREALNQLQVIMYDLHRYVRSFEFSLPTGSRGPLNYTVAFYKRELRGKEKARYRLTIKAYYVAPLIRKHLLAKRTLATSATIGDPEIFGFESGIELPFHSLASDFPVENTRIFMPSDTPNLAMKSRSRQDKTRVLRRIAKTCRLFADVDLRSLVVVVSEAEREKFLMLCEEEAVKAISYGNGIPAKDAAAKFKSGEGDVLVGTVAHYGEGIDLPKNMAPITFFLRPGYPKPTDPATQFEERRFRKMRWHIWNWRVMIEALQARGRNVRSSTDHGVTFFISQQFRRFLFASLPSWLQEAYRSEVSLDKCVQETLQLFGKI